MTDQMSEGLGWVSPSNITDADVYRVILRAMLLRNGGHLRIAAHELPVGPYSILWRAHPEGGFTVGLWEGKVP